MVMADKPEQKSGGGLSVQTLLISAAAAVEKVRTRIRERGAPSLISAA